MSKPAQAAKPVVAPVAPANAVARGPGPDRPARPRAKSGSGKPRAKSSIPRPVWRGALANPDNRLQLAITVSMVVHAIVLTLHFKFPDASIFRHKDSALEVVLVNSKSQTRPDQADARAQANLDGGGNTDEDRRAKTPLPASHKKRDGDALVEAQRRVQELEAMQQKLMTEVRAKASVVAEQQIKSEQPEQPAPVSGADLATSALAIARLEAQIDKQVDEYQKRPRKKFIGARTSEYVAAQYLEDWRQKIERVGTLNYPEAARGRLYGSLLLYLEIKSDGEVARAEIQRSSGNRILDEAALRIVRLAGPFPAFPPDLRQKVDILAFARTLAFTNGDTLATAAARD